LTLVETVPVGTSLKPIGRDCATIWRERIEAAGTTLDWAAFYVSTRPGSRLEPVLKAMEAAAARGVRVRLLADAGFHETYPEVLDRFGESAAIAVRLIDYRSLAGGPMHAKYFVADGAEAYIGSQNTDWRSLDHIWEMGLLIRMPEIAREVGRIFEMDWEQATPLGTDPSWAADDPYRAGPHLKDALTWPLRGNLPEGVYNVAGATASLFPAFSPRDRLGAPNQWDLPLILNALRTAKDSVNVTCLTYNPKSRDGSYWEVLDDALRKAATRGVRVRLMVSDWSKRRPKIDYLKSLQLVPGVEVRLVTIPRAAEGFIPFARVIHSKFMTVDAATFWLGTGNWEKSYFFATRNVGVLAHHPRVAGELNACFLDLWNSPYAYPVDPCADYEPPRIAR